MHVKLRTSFTEKRSVSPYTHLLHVNNLELVFQVGNHFVSLLNLQLFFFFHISKFFLQHFDFAPSLFFPGEARIRFT